MILIIQQKETIDMLSSRMEVIECALSSEFSKVHSTFREVSTRVCICQCPTSDTSDASCAVGLNLSQRKLANKDINMCSSKNEIDGKVGWQQNENVQTKKQAMGKNEPRQDMCGHSALDCRHKPETFSNPCAETMCDNLPQSLKESKSLTLHRILQDHTNHIVTPSACDIINLTQQSPSLDNQIIAHHLEGDIASRNSVSSQIHTEEDNHKCSDDTCANGEFNKVSHHMSIYYIEDIWCTGMISAYHDNIVCS